MLIREARPLRLHDLTKDPRSVGFPANHPPMKSFLGVPIMLRGVAFGNLYLTEKQSGEDFDEQDEELVSLLASQAAVAVENAASTSRRLAGRGSSSRCTRSSARSSRRPTSSGC